MKELVFWAHSECRSNAALYAEVKRLAETMGALVTMCLWDEMPMDESRKSHRFEWIRVGDDLSKGREILAEHGGKGVAHVFCVYQNSPVWRKLIVEAKITGARVIVISEAPCPMCLGFKAWLKKFYYRYVLPCKVRGVTKAADVFINASGTRGIEELVRLGWRKEQIVPFGYASDCSHVEQIEQVGGKCSCRMDGPLMVLHTGIETPYRDVTSVMRAIEILKGKGIPVALVTTGGKVSEEEMAKLYAWADVFVACGLCEPWGMRVNDAIHAGLPVIVSSGMGAKWLVEQFGCGCIYEKGNDAELADILQRFATDSEFRSRLLSGVRLAHEAWSPEARAKVLMDVLKA